MAKRSELTIDELKKKQKEELKKKQAKADKDLAKVVRKWGDGKTDKELIEWFVANTPEKTEEAEQTEE